MIYLIILFAVGGLVVTAVAIAASMRSSQLSRKEEARKGHDSTNS